MQDRGQLNASPGGPAEDVTRLAATVLAQHAADVDASGRFPTESVAALRDRRLLGLCVPRESGGLGQGPRTFAAVTEQLAQSCGSTGMIYVMHVAATQTVAASKTLARRSHVLGDGEIARGEHLTTLAFSESGSRSNFWAPISQLVAENDGFVTSARKS